MSKTGRSQVILLLADGFDEAAVGIILTTLRQAGLAVNLVGLRSKRVSGAHGLMLVPNTSLERLLAALPPILALILPGGAGHLARLRLDPRVGGLIQQSLAEEALLVSLENQATKMMSDLAETNGQAMTIIEPEAGTYLEDFAITLAQQLVGMAER